MTAARRRPRARNFTCCAQVARGTVANCSPVKVVANAVIAAHLASNGIQQTVDVAVDASLARNAPRAVGRRPILRAVARCETIGTVKAIAIVAAEIGALTRAVRPSVEAVALAGAVAAGSIEASAMTAAG